MGKIGRFEVEAEIGRGSMGVVHLAHDPRLQRRVAVKTFQLPAGLTGTQRQEYEERFLREARAAAALSHPGIVTVYDVDRDSGRGTLFIAMEHVAGSTLKQVLDERGRLGSELAVSLVSAVAEALGEAHAAGIVHRDVKPANILIREQDGVPKIADFGVARCTTSELTRSGATLGSPAYMSPEQIRGLAVDARSDLFSLAVILYESLCGERPFRGEDLTALAYSIAHETAIPITRRAATLPAGLDRFFERALAKDPQSRFADAAAFAAALERAMSEPASPGESTVVAAAGAERGAEGQGPSPILGYPGAGPAPPAGLGLDGSPAATVSVAGEPVSRLRRWHLAVVAVVLIVAIGWLLRGSGQAYLLLDGRSSVPEGKLQLLVDGREVYQRELAAAPATDKKAKALLKKLLPSKKGETFEAWIQVPAGKHEVEALLSLAEGTATYRSSVVVDLQSGQTEKVRLYASPGSASRVSLRVD